MYLSGQEYFHKKLQLSYKKCLGVIACGVDYFHLLRHTLGVCDSENLIDHIYKQLSTLKDISAYTRYLHEGQFIILINKPLDSQGYQQICHQISQIFEPRFQMAGHDLFLTFSFGIAWRSTDSSDLFNLVDRAYQALHQAKKRGQNQLVFYQNDLTENLIKKLSLKTQLYRAFKSQEFFLNYQPYVHLQNQHYQGIEALLRWRHPDYGVLLPRDFLSLTESTNLIIPLGKWVLEQSLKDLKNLYSEGYSALDLSINISAKQLMEEDFVPFLLDRLESYQLPFYKICLELTESILLEKSKTVIEKLTYLKQKGFSIAIDDFGVGYSNLHYLINLPLDKIKIDRSFLSSGEILNTLIDLAHRLQIKTLVEGVENHEQFSYLRQTDCHEAQGFLLGYPMAMADLLAFFKGNSSLKLNSPSFKFQ